jgi:hypothetical protein
MDIVTFIALNLPYINAVYPGRTEDKGIVSLGILGYEANFDEVFIGLDKLKGKIIP